MNLACLEDFTSDFVITLMPQSNKAYVRRYWPVVYMALDEADLDYEEMMLMVLATIAAKAGDFDITVREYVSRNNTSDKPGAEGHYFDMYDNRADLGNKGEPD
jgi:putative chitinase